MSIAQVIQQLYQKYGELSGISIECQKDLVAIGVKNKAAMAEVFLQGAQVTRYRRNNEAPLLFLSDACRYKAGMSLRGGIPICWPWFGNLDKNPESVQSQVHSEYISDAPAHGFVRSQDWQVVSITTPSEMLTVIELEYEHTPDNTEWPFAASLHYTVSIGEHLSVSLTVKNLDTQAFTYSSALHSYLSVSDIHSVSIAGFEDAPYIDALDHWAVKQQQKVIPVDREVDRIYGSCGTDVQLNDKQRTIGIKTEGSNSTVVWNPWVEKSQRLSQFNDDDYLRMVCIETANVMDDVVILNPEEEHCLRLTITSM